MNELKELIKEGGAEKVFTRYAVEIGDALWSALYSYIENTYPDADGWCSIYRIEGVFEENDQKFAVLQSRSSMKYYRLNFTLSEEGGFVPGETLIEVTKSYVPSEEPQFALEAVEAYETEYAEKKKAEKETEEDKCPECGKPVSECECEKETCPDCGKPLDECECSKPKYNLEEVVEYAELKAEHEQLQADFNTLKEENEQLKAQAEAMTEYSALKEENETLKADMATLVEFKKAVERKEKEDMIAQFYMLSDEDKADVTANIDTYSLDDIEAKLSIICVRNKVSFNLDENKDDKGLTVFNLNSNMTDDSTPAWVKAAIAVSESKN